MFVFLGADVARRLFPDLFAGKAAMAIGSRGDKIRTKYG
jgi:hypothetical protein